MFCKPMLKPVVIKRGLRIGLAYLQMDDGAKDGEQSVISSETLSYTAW